MQSGLTTKFCKRATAFNWLACPPCDALGLRVLMHLASSLAARVHMLLTLACMRSARSALCTLCSS